MIEERENIDSSGRAWETIQQHFEGGDQSEEETSRREDGWNKPILVK